MSKQTFNVRQVHRWLAPIMVLPLLLTLLTGVGFQLAGFAERERQFRWLMAMHKGHFGALDLSLVYPFLNALGLLFLLATGLSMWLQVRRRSAKTSH